MATTGRTPNYELGKYNPNDITSWDDFNANMQKIDETIHALVGEAVERLEAI